MSQAYEREPFFLAYIKWHYGQGIREFFKVSLNFLWFVAHFFSFKLLFKTLFMPWKRLGENYEGGLDLSAFASTLVVNTLMRAVGFCTKVLVLFVGAISYLFVLFVIFAFLVVWFFAPFVLLGTLVLSATFFVI